MIAIYSYYFFVSFSCLASKIFAGLVGMIIFSKMRRGGKVISNKVFILYSTCRLIPFLPYVCIHIPTLSLDTKRRVIGLFYRCYDDLFMQSNMPLYSLNSVLGLGRFQSADERYVWPYGMQSE